LRGRVIRSTENCFEGEAKHGGGIAWDANGNPITSVVHQGGIATIHWTKDLQVEFLEIEDGQTLYPTPAQGRDQILLIAVSPLLGFFIPWAAVRAIGWVLAGFFQLSK
jgi:hypothetical protein